MKSLNKVEFIGNVGANPETKTLESGNTVSTFSIATSDTYKNKQGEKQTQTYWHSIVVWGKLAEIVEKYVKKGDKLFLEGKLTNRSYDATDGTKRYITEIVMNNMILLSNKRNTNETPPEPVTPKKDNEPDDLPF